MPDLNVNRLSIYRRSRFGFTDTNFIENHPVIFGSIENEERKTQ